MEYSINIPDYLMLKHWKELNKMSTLNEREHIISIISALTDLTPEQILDWDMKSIIAVHNELHKIVTEINPEFYPIIEWEGQLWGFSTMSKMTMGEYIDLDTLSKDSDKNINQILAILYRPVTKNNVSGTFMVKSTLKAMKYDVENVFDYYELEKYDPVTRKQRASMFDNFPMEMALGAMAFFLDINSLLLSDSQIYSLKLNEELMKNWMETLTPSRQRLLNTTVGYLRSRNWATPPSYPSQEIKQLQTLT